MSVLRFSSVLPSEMGLPAEDLSEAELAGCSRIFGTAKVDRFNQFQERFSVCTTETDRYALCVQQRDLLLVEKDLLDIEFAYYQTAFAQSAIYRSSDKSCGAWLEFIDSAAKAAQKLRKMSIAINGAAKLWGKALVEHYTAGKTLWFLQQLHTTAKQHPSWELDALPRLQQLSCRRLQLSFSDGRHAFVSGLETTDLANAASWTDRSSFVKEKDPKAVQLPLRRVRAEELPDGYAFDRYGLLVSAIGDADVFQRGSSCNVATVGEVHSAPSESTTSPKTDAGPNEAAAAEVAPEAPSQGSSAPRNDRNTDGTTTPTPDVETALDDGSRQYGRDTSLRRSNRKSVNRETDMKETPPRKGRGKTSIRNQESFARMNNNANSTAESTITRRLKTLVCELPGALGARKRDRAFSSHPDIATHKRYQARRLVHNRDHCARPTCDWTIDEAFLTKVLSELQARGDTTSMSRGSHIARALLPVLEGCRHPNIDAADGSVELHVLDGHEARDLLDWETPEVPILTEGQQSFQWTNPDSAIEEFLNEWLVGYDRQVSVQIPSIAIHKPSFESRTIQQVRERFAAAKKTNDPWNLLDCGNPLKNTLPDFLAGQNCQLLARIRDKVLTPDNAERAVAGRQDWVTWRNIEEWALVSEGGHNTSAHMDSHGFATYITVQTGSFGFAWVSRPTTEQRNAWMNDPNHHDEDLQWRYLVLKPGQTIFFGSGTIHAVFRAQESPTLCIGGHILQWTGIRQWLDVISEQVKFPDSTNEDMTDATEWIAVVEELVEETVGRARV